MFTAAPEDIDTVDSVTSMPLFKSTTVEALALNDVELIDTINSEALETTVGALRLSTEDIEYPISDIINVYEVKKGDTLSEVARLFKVSKNTIIWANDLKGDTVSPGDILVILPMTGIRHTIKKNDTVISIAKKYKADVDDVAKYNGIAKDAVLSIGEVVLVPEGEITVAAPPKAKSKFTTKSTPGGFLVRPLSGGRRTQGLHGNNGVDIAATPGTPVYASAAGRVILAKTGSYNGGYGNTVIISHERGVQTVYAHLRAVYITQGASVNQGQTIGEVGNTGRSTGSHLHFEVRGAKNPF